MIIPSTTIKEADTHYPVLDLIRHRWSARSFSDKHIDQNMLEQLLEAASWAPSSMNEQPWRYIYAHQADDTFKKMHDCLLPGNKPWTLNASVLMISLAKTHHENGRHNKYNLHDTGAANMLLMLEGIANGIYGHVMGGFDNDKTRTAFNISDDYEIVSFIALGYLDNPDKLVEPFHTREITPRARKPLEQFTFHHDMPKH